MRIVFIFTALFLSSLIARADEGDIQILKREKFRFVNEHCSENSTCDLKFIDYFIEDFKIEVQGSFSYGTRMYARYETDKVESLEKYVFVQFIKGCMFTSSLIEDKVVNIMNIGRYLFDDVSLFTHPIWELDSVDIDPAYSSTPSDRHFFYRWNTNSSSFSEETEKYFGEVVPNQPSLYIRDIPGTAFYINGQAKNVSLYFKTCLYKNEDVPLEPSKIMGFEPLDCHSWESSFIYNHQSGKFEYPYEIAPVCKNPQ